LNHSLTGVELSGTDSSGELNTVLTLSVWCHDIRLCVMALCLRSLSYNLMFFWPCIINWLCI